MEHTFLAMGHALRRKITIKPGTSNKLVIVEMIEYIRFYGCTNSIVSCSTAYEYSVPSSCATEMAYYHDWH